MNIKQKLIKEFFENYIDRSTGKIYLLDKAQLQPKLEQLLDDYEQQVSVEPEVIKKTAGKNNYEDMWDEYKTWTENIGEWIHKENFMRAMNEARKDGIRFTKTLMNKYGIAKTFNDRIEKELKK